MDRDLTQIIADLPERRARTDARYRVLQDRLERLREARQALEQARAATAPTTDPPPVSENQE
jgi:hypothetical protein